MGTCAHIYVLYYYLFQPARLCSILILDVFPGPSCLSSNVIARQCAYETLMELLPVRPLAEASKLLRFFFCIALPREIVDIIRTFIYSSPLPRNLIYSNALWMFMNAAIPLKL